MSKKPRTPTVRSLAVYCHGLAERVEKLEKGCRRCTHRRPIGIRPPADAVGDMVEQDEDDPEIEEMP